MYDIHLKNISNTDNMDNTEEIKNTTPSLKYNTQKRRLQLPEYGRNVQKMIDYVKSIPDREERLKCAKSIISIMDRMSPEGKNTEDHERKLWDHLAFMTGYKLDVDYPFPIEQRIGSNKPEQVPYPTSKIHFRHYGHLMEVLLRELSEMPEGEKRDELMKLAAARMRRNLETWNKDSLNDEKIQNDIQRYMDEFK